MFNNFVWTAVSLHWDIGTVAFVFNTYSYLNKCRLLDTVYIPLTKF